MKVTVVLLFCLPVTVALVLKPLHRSQTDSDLLDRSIHRDPGSEVQPEPEDQSTTRSLRENIVIPYTNVRVRFRRRAQQKGCQFGTCQMHNLANTLYRMGQTYGKEHSKGAEDPNGYGR